MARTHKELGNMNVPHPDFKKHYEGRPLDLPPTFPDINHARQERRKYLNSLLKHQPVPSRIPDQVTEKEVHVSANDGYQIPVTVYGPASGSKTSSEGLPIIILMHEGGWHVGDRKDEEMNARLFVRDLDCIVLNVEYRLAPEAQFPTYVEDCYAVLRHVARNPADLHALAKPELGIVLGGSSAGGNLAAVLAQKARIDNLQPPVTGQWLCVPALLPQEVVPEKYAAEDVARTENMQDPVIGWLTSERMKGLEGVLGIKDVDDVDYTPFARSVYPPKEGDKGKLAKAFLQVGGMDPLRDDGLIYERSLREEWGVETRLKVYEGYGHMFWTNWPEMEECRVFWKDILDGMKWLLGQ